LKAADDSDESPLHEQISPTLMLGSFSMSRLWAAFIDL
jgi:hypothetical protein